MEADRFRYRSVEELPWQRMSKTAPKPLEKVGTSFVSKEDLEGAIGIVVLAVLLRSRPSKLGLRRGDASASSFLSVASFLRIHILGCFQYVYSY
jgi:hypothetical protein